ncbi:MAG: hypothetical protein D3909_10910 [Candidatus Electrothrix sp. ATG1]|nr:hypothetical protein [Candidatus Electrothrix sp. ATG1]
MGGEKIGCGQGERLCAERALCFEGVFFDLQANLSHGVRVQVQLACCVPPQLDLGIAGHGP